MYVIMEPENDIYSFSDSEYEVEVVEEVKKPDFSLAPLWIATCIVGYVYGITFGLYMSCK